jgi:hypothetical protein
MGEEEWGADFIGKSAVPSRLLQNLFFRPIHGRSLRLIVFAVAFSAAGVSDLG